MKNKYDIIIIWAWAAGLFTSIESPIYLNKLILEKNKNPWVKVLLSGWERANISNIDIEPERDYFGQNKKALISLFKRFNNYDIISFFEENWVKIVEEDRWRLILESWDSRELLELLLRKSRENNTEIKCDSGVKEINKKDEIFEVITLNNEKYYSEKIVITCGWQSFWQVWTTWDWYAWAKNFWHNIISPHRGLCGLVTKKDLSELSWVSTNLMLEIFNRNNPKKPFYSELGPLLFTHFWISGPIIFNTAVALWEHINSLNLSEFICNLDLWKVPENEHRDYIDRSYILKNIFIKLTFDLENSPKRVVSFFGLDNEENLSKILELQDYRTWKEAKVTGGWVSLDELTNNLESKFVTGLYFAWEILDITGKTWGFNLQFAWTSANVVGKNL
jgi:predicted Rossmann fold flavoprotein